MVAKEEICIVCQVNVINFPYVLVFFKVLIWKGHHDLIGTYCCEGNVVG